MNLLKLLRKFKGKGLDDAQYELLRQGAKRLEENLTLIRTANKLLQENNDLLKDKVRILEDEIRQMRLYGASRHVVSAPPPSVGPSGHIQEISDMTVAILQECLKRALTEFNGAEMAAFLSCKQLEVETALAELVESGLIDQDGTRPEQATFRLTDAGKSYARTVSTAKGA